MERGGGVFAVEFRADLDFEGGTAVVLANRVQRDVIFTCGDEGKGARLGGFVLLWIDCEPFVPVDVVALAGFKGGRGNRVGRGVCGGVMAGALWREGCQK